MVEKALLIVVLAVAVLAGATALGAEVKWTFCRAAAGLDPNAVIVCTR